MEGIKLSYDRKTIEEKKQIYEMYQEIFEDPERFAEYYFEYCYPSNRVLKLLKEDELASMLHLNPYTLRWGDEELPVSYIVAVSTYGQYRRQGMMATLLTKAFHDLYEEGQLFTYLIPASEAYYTPFDFTYVMDWPEAKIERNDTALEKNKIWDLNYEKFQPKNLESAPSSYQIIKIDSSMYAEAAAFLNAKRENTFDMWIQADESYVRKQDVEMQSEDGGLYFFLKEGCPKGFFAATVDEEAVYCTNLWLPEKMRREEMEEVLFAYFKKEKAELIFSGESYLTKTLCKSTPKIMARIICLEKFLEKMNSDQEDCLVLEVEDSFLEENNSCFCWNINNEGSRVEKTSKSPEWKVGIYQLTKVLFGYGNWENVIADAPVHVKEFFMYLHKLQGISITEQV